MSDHDLYDLLIVGAGPAGLGAARTAARLGFKTLVVERLAGPGDLGHACSAVLLPAPGFVSSRPMFDGMFFPQIDLWIPDPLITVRDAAQHCLSPRGLEYQTIFDDAGSPPVIVDKQGLLQLMVDQAASRNAEFRFGTEVTGLLWEGTRVVGVHTNAGDIRAQIVISAEGSGHQLCEGAGLQAGSEARYILMSNEELEAPAVRAEDLGRTVTLGRRQGMKGFSSLLMTAPGQATMSFVTLVDDPDCDRVQSAVPGLAEYVADGRIADLLAGARSLRRSSDLVPVCEAPNSVVADGFIAIGDAVTPAGFLGILPAIFLGRQAALIAAEALDEANTSSDFLGAYDQLYRALILPTLEAEARTTVALLEMADDELDRVAELLNWLHLPIPFLGYKHNVEWDSVCDLVQQFPLEACDWELLRRVVGEPQGPQAVPSIPPIVSIPCDAGVAMP